LEEIEMTEAIVIAVIVGFAALHVAFRLLPKPGQQKMRVVSAAWLNKLGLHAMAQRLLATSRVADKACGSGCDGCGTQVAGDELKVDTGTKVVQFHSRVR
jgi:hypothetical protein